MPAHCCFCGQQCGHRAEGPGRARGRLRAALRLSVQRGQALPEGRQALSPGQPPRSPAAPLERDPSSRDGFRQISWERRWSAPRAIRRIQTTYGPERVRDAVRRVVPDQREVVPGRQVRRLALGTANPRLQRTPLHGVGGRREQRRRSASTARRTRGATSGSPTWCSSPAPTSPSARRSPPATCGGARPRRGLIVADPRVTPLARTADVFWGLPSRHGLGADGRDPQRPDRATGSTTSSSRRTPSASRRRRGGRRPHAAVGAACAAFPRRASSRRPRMGTSRAPGCCCTRAASSNPHQGVENVLSCINLGLATGKYGKPGCGVIDHHRTETAGGADRSRATSATSCPAIATSRTRSTAVRSRPVWELRRARFPGGGLTAQEIMDAIHAGRIKGLLSICFNPAGVVCPAPTCQALDSSILRGHRFFLSRRQHADVVLPGSLQGGTRGTSTTVEGRVVKINAAIKPPGGAARLEDPRRLAHHSAQPVISARGSTEEILPELRPRRGKVDYGAHHVAARGRRDGSVLAVPEPGTSGHATARRAASPRRSGPRSSTRCASNRRRRVVTMRTRSGSPPDAWWYQHYPVGHADAAHRSARVYYPTAVRDDPPRRRGLGVADGDLVTCARRGGDHAAFRRRRTIRPGTPCSSCAHWPGAQAANQLTPARARSGVEDPEFTKCRRSRSSASGPGRGTTDARDIGAGRTSG